MATLNDFFKAAKRGKASELLRFLEAGVKVDTRNKQGDTALMLSAYFGNESAVKLLLDNGAKANSRNSTGQTAIMYACNKKNANIVMLLLKNKADPYLKDESGRSSFDWIPDDDQGFLERLLKIPEEKKQLSSEYHEIDLNSSIDEEPVILTKPEKERQFITTLKDDEIEKKIRTTRELEFENKSEPVNEIKVEQTNIYVDPDISLKHETKTEPVSHHTSEESYEDISITLDEPIEMEEVGDLTDDSPDIIIEEEKVSEPKILGAESSSGFVPITMDELKVAEKNGCVSCKETNPKTIKKKTHTYRPKYPAYPTSTNIIAVRMNWLRWIAVPLVILWHGIVWLAKYLWSLVTVAWRGMIESFNIRYWALAAIGLSVSTFFGIVGWFLSYRFNIPYLILTGPVFGLIALSWSYGEISGAVDLFERKGRKVSFKEMKSNFSNGFNVAGFEMLTVFISAVCGATVFGVLYSAKIPEWGALVQSVLLIPGVFFAGVLVFALIIFIFSMEIIPAHTIAFQASKDSPVKNFFELIGSVLRHIGKKWVRLILVNIPALLFGVIVSIPILLLVGAVGMIIGGSGFFLGMFDPETLMASLIPLTFTWREYVALGFYSLTASAIAGIVGSFLLSNFIVTYHYLYHEEKTW